VSTEFFIHIWTAALCTIKHWCVQSRTYRINMLDSSNCRRSFQKGYLHSWENFLQVPRKAGDVDSWICCTHLNQCCCHCCVLPIPYWCQKCFHGCPCRWGDAPYYTCKQRTRMLWLRWQVEQTAERCGQTWWENIFTFFWVFRAFSVCISLWFHNHILTPVSKMVQRL